jgi:hypothetical protein
MSKSRIDFLRAFQNYLQLFRAVLTCTMKGLDDDEKTPDEFEKVMRIV